MTDLREAVERRTTIVGKILRVFVSQGRFDRMHLYQMSWPTEPSVGRYWRKECRGGWYIYQCERSSEPGYVDFVPYRLEVRA